MRVQTESWPEAGQRAVSILTPPSALCIPPPPAWWDNLQIASAGLHEYDLILLPGCKYGETFVGRAFATAAIARQIPRAKVLVSGSFRGMAMAGFPNLTEAAVGGSILARLGVQLERIWLDLLAEESFGNFFCNEPLIVAASSMLVVTEGSHAHRMRTAALHLYPDVMTGIFTIPSPPEVELTRACQYNSARNADFEWRFLQQVPSGNRQAALQWLRENHAAKPYKDLLFVDDVSPVRLDRVEWRVSQAA